LENLRAAKPASDTELQLLIDKVLDRPFANMIADYRRTGDGRFIWPAHFAGITKEYCQIEKLANLDRIPRPHGFHVSCLPAKIKDASAGWCRAVALVPED
jgi:cyclase